MQGNQDGIELIVDDGDDEERDYGGVRQRKAD